MFFCYLNISCYVHIIVSTLNVFHFHGYASLNSGVNAVTVILKCLHRDGFWAPYLHSVAEIRSGRDGHHGQQAGSRPDVQNDDRLATSLQSRHSATDSLIIFLILKEIKLCLNFKPEESKSNFHQS